MSEVKSFKLAPASMLLDKETIGVINFHCGDGSDGQFGEYSDGHLWIGSVTDDDGKEVYGLHLSTADYPEEGSSTLVEFDPPEDAAQSELAALREELAKAESDNETIADHNIDLQQRLTAAEQLNAELLNLLEHAYGAIDENDGWKQLCQRILAVIQQDSIGLTKPTESVSDVCTSCDGSGEYIDAIGDWRGYCSCPAGVALKNKPTESGASE